MAKRSDHGLWGASLAQSVTAGPLDRDLRVDLAIIGAGFTGCAAALEAAQSGASVAVLEARQIGYGGSGRNVGLVNAGLWLPPDQIIEKLGEAAGRRLIDALGNSPDQVFDLIKTHDIACEVTRSGTLHLAHSPAGLRDLEKRYNQGNSMGARLVLLDEAQTAQRTGSRRFHGALWNPRAGTVQPLAYCHGLAIAAQKAGALIFSDSPVTQVVHGPDGWAVDTAHHRIRARCLLQATNAYPRQAAGGPARFVRVRYCQFATRPLPQALQETILPAKEGCWDTALVMSSIRLDAAGRLIVGGMGDGAGAGARIHRGWARRKLREIYPQAGDIPFEHEWTGDIAMTTDHVPKIQQIGPDGLSIFGYSGRGIATGTVFGRAAAQALLSGDMARLPLPVLSDYSVTLPRAKAAYYETGAVLAHAMAGRARAT